MIAQLLWLQRLKHSSAAERASAGASAGAWVRTGASGAEVPQKGEGATKTGAGACAAGGSGAGV